MTVDLSKHQTPLKLKISERIRRNEKSFTSNLKTLNYLDNILAKQEASEDDFDDAVLLNSKDNFACVTSSNIFFIQDNVITTPSLCRRCNGRHNTRLSLSIMRIVPD